MRHLCCNSLAPCPSDPSSVAALRRVDGEGERGVREGSMDVLSPCPLSIQWRGGTGVRRVGSRTGSWLTPRHDSSLRTVRPANSVKCPGCANDDWATTTNPDCASDPCAVASG